MQLMFELRLATLVRTFPIPNMRDCLRTVASWVASC